MPPVLLCLFCARFALFQTGLWNRNLTSHGLKIELFLQKTQKIFYVFLLRPPSEAANFNTSPMALGFQNFFIRCIEEWTKICKKTVDRPVNRRRFWNLPDGSGQKNPDQFLLWFRHPEKSKATELSKYIWACKDSGSNPIVSWNIICKVKPYRLEVDNTIFVSQKNIISWRKHKYYP